VIYRCGDAEADHLAYMREVAGVGGPNEFPTYDENAVKSFAAVRHDHEAFGSDFLKGRPQAAACGSPQRSGRRYGRPDAATGGHRSRTEGEEARELTVRRLFRPRGTAHAAPGAAPSAFER